MSDFWVFGIETTRHVLTGGLEYGLFFHILGIIIPADELIFQRGGSTTNQCFIENSELSQQRRVGQDRVEGNVNEHWKTRSLALMPLDSALKSLGEKHQAEKQ